MAKNVVIAWVCSGCGKIHTGVADSSGDSFEESKARFIADCESKGETYEFIPTSLVSNEQDKAVDPFSNFLMSLLGGNPDIDPLS